MFNKKYKKIITIEGMNCEHCAKKVKNVLSNLENVTKVKVNLKNKQAIVISKILLEDNYLKKIIENLDYQIVSIKDL